MCISPSADSDQSSIQHPHLRDRARIGECFDRYNDIADDVQVVLGERGHGGTLDDHGRYLHTWRESRYHVVAIYGPTYLNMDGGWNHLWPTASKLGAEGPGPNGIEIKVQGIRMYRSIYTQPKRQCAGRGIKLFAA